MVTMTTALGKHKSDLPARGSSAPGSNTQQTGGKGGMRTGALRVAAGVPKSSSSGVGRARAKGGPQVLAAAATA